MSGEAPTFTIVINHDSADVYARLIGERFPQVRTIIAPDPDRLEKNIEEADALLAFRFPVEVFDKAKKLRWFQSTAAGVDSISSIRDRMGHVTVTNARGIHGELIADYVMAGVTMLHWDLRRFIRDQAERKWCPRFVTPLSEKTLGVVGLGTIGQAIARRAKSAGMAVIGSKRDVSSSVAGVDRVFGSGSVNELLALCDFVVLAIPSTQDTVGLIGAAEIGSMRRDAFLINIARGNVIVEEALVNALQAGSIAGAMLDVFEQEPLPQDSPLWALPNVIATPHVSGTPANYTQRAFAIIAENIERFLNGQPLRNVVDLGRGY